MYRLTADLIVTLHFAVVGFVIAGGLLVLLWRRMAWVHLPIVAWVIFAECFQKLCPLTYLENWLRGMGKMETYRGDFVAHYITPVLYPEGLTPRVQVALGLSVFAINATLYFVAFRSRTSAQAARETPSQPHNG